MADETPPILPAVPWWQSEVQLRAVIALGAQLVSILFRVIGRYTDLEITGEQVDLVVADITQGIAILFGILAVTKRQASPIQPLTMTKTGAEAKNIVNPPIQDTPK